MATHVGLIVLGPHGERHILHSSEPEVREETFDAYIARAAAREERDRQAGKDYEAPQQVLAQFVSPRRMPLDGANRAKIRLAQPASE